MKEHIKSGVKLVLLWLFSIMSKTRIGQYLESMLIESGMNRVVRIVHKDLPLTFCAPNPLAKWRYETFSSKEPETLEWIDGMPLGSVLWDIGANVGLYSVYAAKKKKCKVYAFEPSVFNLELLARNIFLNGLSETVCVVPIALTDKVGPSQMKMTSTEWGGALSTFGESYGWDGNLMQTAFEFQTIGLRVEDVVTDLLVLKPDYIKLDVDGIEHLILNGGREVLRNVKGVLIEVNDAFQRQASECRSVLSESGLVLKDKRQSEMTSSSTMGFQNSFNQIWIRPSVD